MSHCALQEPQFGLQAFYQCASAHCCFRAGGCAFPRVKWYFVLLVVAVLLGKNVKELETLAGEHGQAKYGGNSCIKVFLWGERLLMQFTM